MVNAAIKGALGLVLSIASSLSPQSIVRATHYGSRFEGRTMADGHIYHSRVVSVASNQYDLGTVLRIVNPLTGIGVYARVTDRTAKTKHGKPVLDMSERAFDAIGLSRKKGWGWVRVSPVSDDAGVYTK